MVKKHGCLFYENRTCHIRQHLNIDKELITVKKITSILNSPNPYSYIVADAAELMFKFCHICPHIRKLPT